MAVSRPQIFLCYCLACIYFRVDAVSPQGKTNKAILFSKDKLQFFSTSCNLEILSILIIFVFSVLRIHVCCIVVMIIVIIIIIIIALIVISGWISIK